MSTELAHDFSADDYPATVTCEVPGLGECLVGDLMMDEAMRLFLVDRPHRLDYRHWVSDFLATSLSDPSLDLPGVENLSDLARERLRAAAADTSGCGGAYRALAGSHLSRDERLFAAYYSTTRDEFASFVTLGADLAARAATGLARAAVPVLRPLVVSSAARLVQAGETLAGTFDRALARRLEGLSRSAVWVPPLLQTTGRSLETAATNGVRRQLENLARAIAANREPLRGGLLVYEALQALGRHRPHERLGKIEQSMRLGSQGPLGYVTEPLRPGLAIEVIALIEAAGEAALLDLLERAARDEEVVARLRTAIRELSELSQSKRQRLEHALAHVLEGEFVLAVDGLIAVVEGLFWLEAERRGLINDRDHFTPASGKKGPARGVEKLFGPLGVTDVFAEFLVRRAYGGRGHPFRHGRADEGEREQVLFLLVALVGWLETFAGVPARAWLFGALQREISAGSLVGATLEALDEGWQGPNSQGVL